MSSQLVNYNGQLINLNGGVLANKFPIRDGLVFYLDGGVDKCYAGTGTTATDLSVSSVSTSLNNGVVFSEDNKGYFSFDGIDDYMATDANIDLTHTTEYTVCMWVRHPNKPDTVSTIWIEQSTDFNSNNGAFYTGWGSYGVPGAFKHLIKGYSGVSKYQAAYTEDPYDSNTWQFFVVTYDGTQSIGNSIKMYMNGEEIEYTQLLPTDNSIFATFTDWTGDLNRFYFGSRGGNSSFTEFDLGAYYVYDRVLSQDEIRAIYNHQKQRFEHIITDGLVLDLDATNLFSYPGTGTTWSDLSPSGNDATLTNGPTFQSDPAAIVFDGVDDYGTFSGVLNNFSDGTEPFSIEMWISAPDHPNGYWGYALHNSTGTAIGNSFVAIAVHPVTGYYLASVFGQWTEMITSVHKSNIAHIVLTYDGNLNQKVYANNSFENSYDQSGSGYYPSTITSLGGTVHDAGYRPLEGNIYEVRVYNKELTADEIDYNFNARRGRYGI